MKTHMLLTLLFALGLEAGTIYVNQQNKPKNADGQSWESAYKNLNKALKTAKSGDDIWVAKGEYILKPTRLEGVNIYGGFSATEVELSQREIVNNETKIFGRIALQNALISSVTMLEEPEKHRVVEINFNKNKKSSDFRPNKKLLADERKRRHQRDLKEARNRPVLVEEEKQNEGSYSPEDTPRSEKQEQRVQKQSPSQERKGPPRPEEAMQMFDTNADGKISKDEAPAPMKRDWNRLDKNKDGFVEEREITPPKRDGQRPPKQQRR